MESWLKALIAAACIVIIVAGGYFLVGELRAKRARDAAEQRALDVLACNGALQATSDTLIKLREDCLSRGLITADEYWASKQPKS